MQIQKNTWDVVCNSPTQLLTILDDSTGFEVQLSDFGATLVRVKVPDKDGKVLDLNYGQDDPNDYIKYGGFLGAVTGRVANRIANACFTLNEHKYPLHVNAAGSHCLHGGKESFNFKIWNLENVEENQDEIKVTFKYLSPDMEEGFPGNLETLVTYTIEPNTIGWEITATTDKPTIVNITNHAYWNLDGVHTLIDEQEIRVDSTSYMPADGDCLATGEVWNVKDHNIDLHEFTRFQDIFATFGDLDNNFFLDGHYTKNSIKDTFLAATVRSPSTGITMDVHTSEPCVQLYSGNFMDSIVSFGKQCNKHGAICLETQRPPNAINNPVFARDVILHPGEEYFHKTVHRFSIDI